MATITEGKLKTNRKGIKSNKKPILPPLSSIGKSECIHKWTLKDKFETEKVYATSYYTNSIIKITKMIYVCSKCGEIKVME